MVWALSYYFKGEKLNRSEYYLLKIEQDLLDVWLPAGRTMKTLVQHLFVYCNTL